MISGVTLIVILLVILLLYRPEGIGGPVYYGGGIGLVLLVLLVLILLGVIPIRGRL